MDSGVRKIISAVADEYGVTVDEILGESRKRKISDARLMSICLIRQKCKLTVNAIGEIFGRSHATICRDSKRMMELTEYDKATKLHYLHLKEKI